MKKTCVLFFVILFLSGALFAQQMKSMEFRNQDIRDILLSLAELNSVSVIPDETVDGKASYVFSNIDFEEALKAFLDSYRLYYVKKNGVYYISKLNVTVKETGLMNLSASDTPLKSVLRALSSLLSKTILFDNLPNDPITINVKDATLEDVLKIVIARYPDFLVEKQEKFYYIRNKAQDITNKSVSGGNGITRSGDNFNLQIDKGRFKDLLINLFGQASKEFILLLDRDVIIENVFLKNKTFEEALKILLLNANADFDENAGIYYIYEVQRKDLLKKYMTNVIIPFEYISSADFLKLLPANLNSGSFFKLDDKGNKIILSGSMEEIKPIWDFIVQIDKPVKGNSLVRIDLSYLKTDEFFPLLPPEFATFTPQALPGKNSFIIQLPEKKTASLKDFVNLVDRPQMGFPIRLRFLKADDLFGKLPPSVTDTNLAKTNDASLVFFKGTPKQREEFLQDLEEIDVPRPQLRYELMVIQYDDLNGLNLTTNVTGNGTTASPNAGSISGVLGNILNLNMDVIANFGYHFAVALNAGLQNQLAKVLADTTLNGLSGEKLSFQNTKTTRYFDNQINPDTGKPAPVVRELASGLILSLEGWISADSMITVKIDATLSKSTPSNADASGQTPPPSTSEKKISTIVRTLSGKPLVVSGLKEDDVSLSVSKVPLLGDIPLIGLFFQTRSESVEHTEYAIYVVPILERPEKQDTNEESKVYAYYKRLSKGF